jgi:peptidoglycan/xylan/chitin deacetylase (PgdA/CDA1 family)
MRVRIRWLNGIAAAWLVAAPAAPAAVVLQYHHVSDTTPASTSTSPERFAMHLDVLEQAGFEIVRLEDLAETLAAGEPLPDRAAAITFDDGYRSIYETAWPLLKRRGWPFTVFVNSAPHDQGSPQFMSWDQLRELHAGGATIANHTVSHPHLLDARAGRDEAAWREAVQAEISGAQARIRQEIGTAPMLFAWPFGEFDAALLERLGELGYTGFGQQSGPLAAFSDRRALPRFPFGGPYGDRADFISKIQSLPLPLADGTDSIRLLSSTGQPLADTVLAAPARPVLMLRLAAGFDPGRLACFASGQGRAEVRIEGAWAHIQAQQPLGQGRARYNCTAPSARAGRYHWFSQPWIIRQEPRR